VNLLRSEELRREVKARRIRGERRSEAVLGRHAEIVLRDFGRFVWRCRKITTRYRIGICLSPELNAVRKLCLIALKRC
jgi:hypothetical protein